MSLSRRDFMKLSASAATFGLRELSLPARAPSSKYFHPAKRPNVIMIVIDTLRADHTSAHGYARATTPNLQELANTASVFKNAISPAPWTYPTYVSLMSAKHAFNHNQNLCPCDAASLDCHLLPTTLSENGYQTILITTNCIFEELCQGFQQYYSFCEYGSTGDQLAIDTAIQLLQEELIPKGSNFFLLIWLMSPHRPYETLNGILEEFLADDLYTSSEPKTVPILGQLITPSDLSEEALSIIGYPLTHDGHYHDSRLYVAAYDAEIKYADYHIGRLLSYIKESGLFNDLMVVATSDHGENMTDHLSYFCHGDNLYNSLLHVPLIIKFPHQTVHSTIHYRVRTTDILPTIFNVLNIDIDAGEIDGKTLVPFLSRKPVNLFNRPVVAYRKSSLKTYELAVIRGRYKLIKKSDHTHELYDCIDDPDETNNLISSLPDVFSMLDEYLSHHVPDELFP